MITIKNTTEHTTYKVTYTHTSTEYRSVDSDEVVRSWESDRSRTFKTEAAARNYAKRLKEESGDYESVYVGGDDMYHVVFIWNSPIRIHTIVDTCESIYF